MSDRVTERLHREVRVIADVLGRDTQCLPDAPAAAAEEAAGAEAACDDAGR